MDAVGRGQAVSDPGTKRIELAFWPGNDLVPGAGIEPARNYVSRDFKSLASTSSATQAVR